MANTTTSPNMNLPVPVVSVDPGPDWATNIDACLGQIDSHNHSSGQGVQIMPDGININSDLPFNGNNATTLRSARFTTQASPLALASDVDCLYVSGVDLYYNDGSGNQVRITTGGNVNAGAGSITGLPSGTASASFGGGAFTWRSATNTPATMNVGPLVIGAQIVSPNTVTLGAPSALGASYNLTFPLAAPSANQVPVSDGSGNLAWSWGLMPIGSVIATFPNLTGAYSTSATTSADAYGFVKCVGQTIVDSSSPMNGQVVPNINNSIFLQGSTTAGSSGGAATSSGLAAHTHTFTSDHDFGNNIHTHNFPHTHEVLFQSNNLVTGLTSSTPSNVTIDASSPHLFTRDLANVTGGGELFMQFVEQGDQTFYSAGANNGPGSSGGATIHTDEPNQTSFVTGTTGSTGTSSFSILPPYISAVYLMRIK